MDIKNILALPKSSLLDKKEYERIVEKIPVNPIATKEVIDALKKVPEGESPLDLVFAVKFKDSKNERVYTVGAYRNIVNQILYSEVFIPVCYGHQNKDNITWEGRKIVGSVIGALLDEPLGIIYYRIIPDASKENEDIRRWIRNKQLNAISIWGYAVSEKGTDEKEKITDFTLLSIDFVPPFTEGQENIALIMGESYSKVEERIIVNPKNNEEANMSIENISNELLQNEFKKRAKDGRISLKAIAGEIGFKALTEEEVAISEKEKEELKAKIEDLLEHAKKLGFKTLDELFDFAVDTLKKFENEKLQGEFNKFKEEVMTEKGLLKDGKLQGHLGVFVDKYAPIKQGMTREEIKKVIDKMLEDETLKSFITEGVTGESVEVKGEMLDNHKKEKEIFFEI